MTKITVACVQMESTSSVDTNIQKSKKLMETALRNKPEIIVFPEYQMLVPDYFEGNWDQVRKESESFLAAMKEASSSISSGLLINYWEFSGKRPYNTSLLIRSGDVKFRYRKIHLYDALKRKESDIYIHGDPEIAKFTIDGFTAGTEICYDIRFPELSYLMKNDGINLIFVQAGWYSGEGKQESWRSILRARAIENGAYVVAAAQCGTMFSGNSLIMDPYGKVISILEEGEGVVAGKIDTEIIRQYNTDYPLQDQKRFRLRL
ncbi:MAG: nitrilase-related carbon-nitrogen hydrolase [Thermoplasmata archaeon]